MWVLTCLLFLTILGLMLLGDSEVLLCSGDHWIRALAEKAFEFLTWLSLPHILDHAALSSRELCYIKLYQSIIPLLGIAYHPGVLFSLSYDSAPVFHLSLSVSSLSVSSQSSEPEFEVLLVIILGELTIALR